MSPVQKEASSRLSPRRCLGRGRLKQSTRAQESEQGSSSACVIRHLRDGCFLSLARTPLPQFSSEVSHPCPSLNSTKNTPFSVWAPSAEPAMAMITMREPVDFIMLVSDCSWHPGPCGCNPAKGDADGHAKLARLIQRFPFSPPTILQSRC